MYERKLCMCDESECVALRGAFEPVLGRPGFYWLPLPGPESAEPAAEAAEVSPMADNPAEPDSPEPEVSDFAAREMTADERRSWNAAIDRQMQISTITQRR